MPSTQLAFSKRRGRCWGVYFLPCSLRPAALGAQAPGPPAPGLSLGASPGPRQLAGEGRGLGVPQKGARPGSCVAPPRLSGRPQRAAPGATAAWQPLNLVAHGATARGPLGHRWSRPTGRAPPRSGHAAPDGTGWRAGGSSRAHPGRGPGPAIMKPQRRRSTCARHGRVAFSSFCSCHCTNGWDRNTSDRQKGPPRPAGSLGICAKGA